MDYILELRTRDCNKVFLDDLGPGVLVREIVHFGCNDPHDPMLAISLRCAQNVMLRRYIEVIVKEVNVETKT